MLRQELRLAYFAPAHGMNPATQALYESNRLTVTRQLKYSLANENSIDLVLGLNGLPVVTAELKNPMSGQTWRDAVWQYKTDRDPARDDLPLQAAHASCTSPSIPTRST